MGGQVGLKDHVTIGDGVMIGAQSGVHQSIPSGQQVLGAPAMPVREQRRLFALLARLPEMHRQVRELAAQVARMMGTEAGATDDLDDAPREG
jgi:UDP-3-O-[3-hydroxymyristoyl] glucosamine N-acyltransferase